MIAMCYLVNDFIIALVEGPTAPKPVVLGVPLRTIENAFWNSLTAASVLSPKYPLSFPDSRKPNAIRNC